MYLYRNYLSRRVILFFIFIFFCFIAFFTLFHPAFITTPDDWYYVTYTRDAIPLLPKNNPTRVLPETLMPLVSNISSQLLMPLGLGFEMSIACGAAFVLALMIVVYTYSFFVLIRKHIGLNETPGLCLSAIFLLFHFLIFRSVSTDNPYLLGAFCLTNYYYYTIPILLNASVVMYCISTDILHRLSKLSYWKFGLFLLVVYFCMLSNLYSNIIIVVYFFFVLLQYFIANNYDLKKSLRANRFVVAMLLFYLVILIFEANGGNAKDLSTGVSYFEQLHHTIGYYLLLLSTLNLWFVALLVIFLILFIFLKKKKGTQSNSILHFSIPGFIFIISSFILLNIFSILICAKSRPYYVMESDKMFMEFFWLVFGLSFLIAYCIKKMPQLEALLPLLFILLFCHTNTKSKTFEDVMWYDSKPLINQQLFKIINKANELDVDSLTLYVPKMDDTEANWPYPLYFGDNLAKTFYSHRLSRKLLFINIVPVEGLDTLASSLNEYKIEGPEEKLETLIEQAEITELEQ